MKILSIDCGIKNLAICFLTIDAFSHKQLRIVQDKIAKITKLDTNGKYKEELINLYNNCIKKNFQIHFWDNINMFPLDARFDDLKCEKKGCSHVVKFHKNFEIGFCTRHVKKSELKGIKQIKEKNAKLISYVDIAKAIMTNLDKLKFIGIDKIFIEQQPQKNGRMKHFQMMLFQYLVMRFVSENLSIHFVSPKHKLRGPDCGAFYKASTKKNKYAQNKEVSVRQTHKLLKEASEASNMSTANANNKKWYKFLCGIKTKQDDYCDCFLQAYMYFDIVNN